MAVSSFAKGVLLVGLANARNVLPLVLVEQKFGPQRPHQRKLSTFVIFVEAFLIPATFSPTYLNRLFSTTTIMLASDGHTIWLPRLHATLSFGKTQFRNGCKIKPSMFNTSLAKSIRLMFLLKRWGMAHISGVFGILSCHICPISSMIHFWQSITPISNLPNNLSHLLWTKCWRFIPLLISLPSHHLPSVSPSWYFTSMQCWSSASPEFSRVCSTTTYIAVVPLIILVWSGLCPSFPLSWLLPEIFPLGIYLTLFWVGVFVGCTDGGCQSVHDPMSVD
jgi:hypothetical protein